jgi:hypothetical protein
VVDEASPAKIMADAKASSILLRNLATDCLRLLMHFFYPIQQCAEQVYHTALPLSPTSSHLRNSCLQSAADNQLSCVTAFLGAPDTWGSLLRTINVRPRQPTCIATPTQGILAACEDVVNVYDAVTFVLRQSLHVPDTVTKMLGSLDGSALFFAHSHSITMWDVQTGGLTHTFTMQSEITDIAISTREDRIACGSSDGSITFWDIRTKEVGEGFGNGQPVVTICWLSSQELAVATQSSIYVCDITTGKTSINFPILGRVWGMVYTADKHELVVGILQPGKAADQELCSLGIIKGIERSSWSRSRREAVLEQQPRMYLGLLLRPTVVGEEIVCIAPPSGARSFNTESCNWTENPPLLDAATSVAVSLDKNLVAQTNDSIQIFSFDVLKSGNARNDVRPSHVYPLGEEHVVCLLHPNRHLTILELRTLRKLRPKDNSSSLAGSLSTDRSSSARASLSRGFVAEFGASAVMKAWRSDTPLPEWTEAAEEEAPLGGLSPECTRTVIFYGPPRRELRVKDAKTGTILAKLFLGDDDLEMGEVYDLIFDSEARFHLKIDGPERYVQVPPDIIPSQSRGYSHKIIKGEPVLLSEPRTAPPYTLDTNCEWVVDAESRKICWISPGNVRRGSGGHFWAGQELIMVGGDGVVRKVSFREPNS